MFDQAIAAFAETYADQNEKDYRALADAAASGRITAETVLVEVAIVAGSTPSPAVVSR